MDRLRQFLAFPMYASAVWMIMGADPADRRRVIYALGGMILIAAIWLLRIERARTWLRRGLAAAAVLLAFGAALKLEDSPADGSFRLRTCGRCQFRRLGCYSRERLNQAVAGRQAGVRRFHPAWCITLL